MPARILIIEDNPANLELARYLLAYRGHDVLMASNGEEGVSAAQQQRPDLVICDLQLPKLDGYQVLQRLRADPATEQMTIVAVTAFSMAHDRERVLAAGFQGYISKPIEPEHFVGQIEAFMAPEVRGHRPLPDGS